MRVTLKSCGSNLLHNLKIVLLFPPNWSAVVNSPHLALPLVAGALDEDYSLLEIWDLSKEFYDRNGSRPDNKLIIDACDNGNITLLDKLYFDWENYFIELAKDHKLEFGLISGFYTKMITTFNYYYDKIKKGTVFSEFYNRYVYQKLKEIDPILVGISISSANQILPTIELLIELRKILPKSKIVLGGNVVTRLSNSSEFNKVMNLADYVVLFQGERVIKKICNSLIKVNSNTNHYKKIYSDEFIPITEWPIPVLHGLNLKDYLGIQTLPFVSTRGCYWGKCSFCAISAGWSRKGYSGSMTPDLMIKQIKHMVSKYKINRIKFVDETFPPSKVIPLSYLMNDNNLNIYWEAYVRLEPEWEDENFLRTAYNTGCRKLYFGLELSPYSKRDCLHKNDNANIITILEVCKKIGILVHLFCMVGHPETNETDANLTVKFLIDHQDKIDTADLVGFQLHRGISIKGIHPKKGQKETLSLTYEYKVNNGVALLLKEVQDLEKRCQERIWEEVPRLIHPLYRIGKSWKN